MEIDRVENNINSKKGFMEGVRANPWRLSTVVLGVVLVFLFLAGGGITGRATLTGSSINSQSAGQNIVDFLNGQTGGGVELVSIDDYSSNLYEVVVLYQDSNIPVFMTKDGKYFVEGVIPLTSTVASTTTQQAQPQPSSYSESDLEKLRDFNQCLAESGMVIYGANWCVHTMQVVDLLGGFGNIGGVYIECTEQQALCQTEGIMGYPTIKLNGEDYKGARTLESFAQTTGCSAPILETQTASTSSEVQC